MSPRQNEPVDELNVKQTDLKGNYENGGGPTAVPITLSPSMLPVGPLVDAGITVERVKKLKKIDDLPWMKTPLNDFSKLGQNYLALSKFRLTCKFVVYFSSSKNILIN